MLEHPEDERSENEPAAREQPGAGSAAIIVRRRRRRTSRHRRNRRVRRILALTFCALLTACCAAVAVHYVIPSLSRSAQRGDPDARSVEESRNLFLAVQQASLKQFEGRPVYKYSVVPGGVKDAKELKWAAEHDPVVAAHYAGFDYDHARVVRLTLARTAYVSYRIGNKIYWTNHRISLRKGETVITDGKMMARTRCANRIEDVPPQHTQYEPPPDLNFEDQFPFPPINYTPSVPYSSIVYPPASGANLPLTVYDPLTATNVVPVLPAPVPEVCGLGGKKKGTGGSGTKKHTGIGPCGSGGSGAVPEPGSWLLMATGLALMFWKFRNRLHPTPLP